MIGLTKQQRAAVEHRGNLLLSACPGSGKTRVILAKLLSLTDDVSGTPKFIGCITYTNAAVDEIEARLRLFGNGDTARKCDVSTIHAFCLNFILRPYCWLVPDIPAPFKVMTADTADFEQIVAIVEEEAGRSIQRSTYDDYSSLRIDAQGKPCGKGYASGIVTTDSAHRYWQLVRGRGYLDFSQILYYSWLILSNHSFVGRGLAARFHWLLVDEFQDTTDIQLAIFRELQRHLGTRFFLVGDHNQSIMSFAGARPDLAHQFATHIQAELNLRLTGNFRSGQKVIDAAEAVIPNTPPMTPEGEAKTIDATVYYVRPHRPIDAITDYFLPLLEHDGIPLGKAAILAPWWTHLVPVARGLRDQGIPVYGPGARPYRRKRLFVDLAEQLGACAGSDHYLGLPGVERAIFRLVNEIGGKTNFEIFSYEGRRTALKLIYAARAQAEAHSGGANWLTNMAAAAADMLYLDGWIEVETKNSLVLSASEMIDDMRASGVDLANLQIADLGLFANPDHAMKLITLHHSKGREFDAVAMINLNEGQLPNYRASSQADIDDARRQFYVGVTRAKKLLLMVSDRSDHRNRPTRFIAETGTSLTQ